MGSSSSDKSDHPNKPAPGASAHAAADGKRAECDRLEFWRRCKRGGCRRQRRCGGDPYLCFGRKQAEMPRDHKDWPRVAALAKAAADGGAGEEAHATLDPVREGRPSPAAEAAPPPAWQWTGPLNPPQATCDDQGRLIIPDQTEYCERLRRGMSWGEILARGRG